MLPVASRLVEFENRGLLAVVHEVVRGAVLPAVDAIVNYDAVGNVMLVFFDIERIHPIAVLLSGDFVYFDPFKVLVRRIVVFGRNRDLHKAWYKVASGNRRCNPGAEFIAANFPCKKRVANGTPVIFQKLTGAKFHAQRVKIVVKPIDIFVFPFRRRHLLPTVKFPDSVREPVFHGNKLFHDLGFFFRFVNGNDPCGIRIFLFEPCLETELASVIAYGNTDAPSRPAFH